MRTPLAAVVIVAAAALPSAEPLAATADTAPRWSWSVAAPRDVVRDYTAPASPWGAGHRGIDVTAASGTPVAAPEDGVVVHAGPIVDRGVLAIEHADGVRSSFEPVEARVAEGDRVRRGQVVAEVAAGGTHPPGVLHLGARVHGAYVSPLLFLGGLERAVLLPLAG